MKSLETTSSSVYPRIPWRSPSEAAFMAVLIWSYEASLARRTVRSTTETSGVGARNASRVREHRETPKHAAASRPRTPQRDMPCWLHEINGTPQRQNRPFQRDPQHQQTAHPAVPSRSRSEHGDSDDPYHVFLCVKRAVQRACVVRCHALRTRCVGNSKPIILPAHATGTRVR